MAKKHITKNESYSSIAKPGNDAEGGLLKAALFTINDSGYVIFEQAGIFLLNPSSYEEAKSSNWVQSSIPGQSDPVLQWSSSGARTITFDALVTADTTYYSSKVDGKPGKETNPINKAIAAVGKIASNFFKVSVPIAPRGSLSGGGEKNSLDISNYLNYYRSLLYPEYDKVNNPKKLVRSPPLVALFTGNTFSNIKFDSRISNNHDIFVVTNLRIKITKQLPNLAPMEAIVSFELVQYNIRSFDRNRFNG